MQRAIAQYLPPFNDGGFVRNIARVTRQRVGEVQQPKAPLILRMRNIASGRDSAEHYRANPSTSNRAPSRRLPVGSSTMPMTCRTRLRGTASIRSVMICERTRSPVASAASMIGLIGNLSAISVVIGHASTVVVVSPNSSACTMTAGRGLPSSPYATMTMSPRFTATRLRRISPLSRRRSDHFPGAGRVTCPAVEDRPVPADRANPGPNAALAASPGRAGGSAGRSCAPVPSLVVTFWP